MSHRQSGPLATSLALTISMFAALAGPVGAQTAPAPPAAHWVGCWAADPSFPTGPEVSKQTVRQVVRLSLGGRAVRIRISNELGTAPLVIGAAHLARPGSRPGSIDPGTDHALTFGGRQSVTLPPGAPAVSDPVELDVRSLDSLSVSLYLPFDTGPTATHPLGNATAYLAPGDQTADAALDGARSNGARFFLTGVEVDAPGAAAVVTLGDSITDGHGSTANANRRWPDVLAERLAAANMELGVVDAGISGNRVLHDLPEAHFGPSALARFDRDVLAVPGVRTVILLESINDIGQPGSAGLPDQKATADDIIAGLRQLADRAHDHGLRILGATLTPFADTAIPGYFTPAGEADRQVVNRWIRDGGAFDGVVDFDAALRDPARPDHMAAAYDSGDHLHPNDAGYRKMGEAIDLKMLDGR